MIGFAAMEPASARQRDHLSNIIAQWNANRLDLFELSEPNEQLEFHGVMRWVNNWSSRVT